MRSKKIGIFILGLLLSNFSYVEDLSQEVLTELNQSVNGYIDGLNSGNTSMQRKYVCQKDSRFFDLTSPLSFFIPIMKLFTGNFSAGELSDFKIISDDKIDAKGSIISEKNPNNPNVGRVTFVKEEGVWKTCSIRH